LSSRSNNEQSTAKNTHIYENECVYVYIIAVIIGSYNYLSHKIFLCMLWTLCVSSCGPAAIPFRIEAQR